MASNLLLLLAGLLLLTSAAAAAAAAAAATAADTDKHRASTEQVQEQAPSKQRACKHKAATELQNKPANQGCSSFLLHKDLKGKEQAWERICETCLHQWLQKGQASMQIRDNSLNKHIIATYFQTAHPSVPIKRQPCVLQVIGFKTVIPAKCEVKTRR